jgi:hypothetical protein
MSNIFDQVIGSAWNHAAAKPNIDGTAGRSREEIVSFTVGGTAVARNSASEPFYLSDENATSFVGRAVDTLGVSSTWTALYAD